MKLVDKYILKQLLNNSFLILLLIISLFCLAKSVQLVELMVGRGLPFFIFIKLILFSLPQIIPTLLPVIVSLSVFFVLSRMQTDKELIILQSSSFNVFDISGNCWIDFTSTIFVANVGHSNERVTNAIKDILENPLLNCYAYTNPIRAK